MGDTTNIIEFKADIKEFAERVRVETGTAMKGIAEETMRKVRELTPVSSGRARDNWNMSLDSPDDSYDPHENWKKGEAHDPKPIPDLPIDGTKPVFITNNAPYILLLENGSSDQAPSGMASLAVETIEGQVTRPL